MTGLGDVGEEDAGLAVVDAPGGAGVLAGDASALVALLEKTGLVDGEDATFTQ